MFWFKCGGWRFTTAAIRWWVMLWSWSSTSSSIIWYRPRGGDAFRPGGNCWSGVALTKCHVVYPPTGWWPKGGGDDHPAYAPLKRVWHALLWQEATKTMLANKDNSCSSLYVQLTVPFHLRKLKLHTTIRSIFYLDGWRSNGRPIRGASPKGDEQCEKIGLCAYWSEICVFCAY